MSTYHHRQLGTAVLWVLGLTALLLVLLLYFVGAHPIGTAVLSCLVLCLAVFATLTVAVTPTHIILKFGVGFIRKRFPLRSIRNVRAVRNEWYYGLGIRMLARGWLYNVSGLDAVELEMTDGNIHRIGTDEPVALLKAIRDACGVTS